MTGFNEKHISSVCLSSLKTLSYTGIFPRKTHPSTPPFSSCFKISEKVEHQKTKHNIQLKTTRSVKMPNSARQLIHLQFHWDHRDCGNAAFRNFSHVTKQRFSIHHFSSYSLSLFIRREGNPGYPTCIVNALLGITRLPGTTFLRHA